MFRHKQIWAAFETIAKRCGMSLSALSTHAGLDPTSFNPSKRSGPGGRERWPSTETLARVLEVADMTMRDFADILDAQTDVEPEGAKLTRRRHKRILSVLEGRIQLEPEGLQIPCTLRDISAGGARLWMPGALELPSEFHLEIPKLGQSLRVRLVWSRVKSHGVKFLDELRQLPEVDVTSLVHSLQAPDDETYFDNPSELPAPPSEEPPKRRSPKARKG